ncbi:MAG TPA: NAD(P)H-dependent glycerol-3-phosphate dehydrogenase, partial [Burkholderiaceae bacterium]|nr:NAD(P)H-dependent glycerol-3-phosphate dehydrogenase [Burkholderiaceae bacterium]
VLGAGAWGTAMAAALSARHCVVLYARNAEQCAQLTRNHINTRYLPAFSLPAALRFTDDLHAALNRGASAPGLTLIATPTDALRSVVRAVSETAPPAPLVWLCKGLEQSSGQLPHQIVREELGDRANTGPLSGPSFASEVACGLPSALTVAGAPEFCEHVTEALHFGAMRIYSTDDVVGVEVGGAVKNVMAIATGISDALALGLNARAALITRGLAEMTRFGIALGARGETFMGLTGIGDLILTATGDLSRNRKVGLALGRGAPMQAAVEELGHVAEGVRSAHAVLARARGSNIDMPITEAVCAVLDGALTPAEALYALLAREPKVEVK